MGLIAGRPQEPTEWAGLPSEPAQTLTDAESLAPPSTSVDALGLEGAVESIIIRVTPPPDEV